MLCFVFAFAGVTGELIAGRADIAAFPLVQAPGRPSVIDLTYSYYESGLGVLVQKEVSGIIENCRPVGLCGQKEVSRSREG